MRAHFDPHYEWLGISPDEQPASYYRLLGLREFESNAQVISNAADRQMSHVRSFQSGPYSVQSQQLLNELAAARVCLLKPDKKLIYDEQLATKRAIPAETASPIVPAVAAPTTTPTSTQPFVQPPFVIPHHGPKDFPDRSRKRKSNSAITLLWTFCGCAIALVAVVVAAKAFREGQQDDHPKVAKADTIAVSLPNDNATSRADTKPPAVARKPGRPTVSTELDRNEPVASPRSTKAVESISVVPLTDIEGIEPGIIPEIEISHDADTEDQLSREGEQDLVESIKPEDPQSEPQTRLPTKYEQLMAQLQAVDSDSREKAARELGRLKAGDEKVIELLLKTIEEDVDSSVRDRCVWALAQIGTSAAIAVPILVRQYKTDPHVRRTIVYAMEVMGSESDEAVQFLVDVARDAPSGTVRPMTNSNSEAIMAACDSLGRLGERGAPGVPVILSRLKFCASRIDKFPQTYVRLANILAKIGDKRALAPFAQHKESKGFLVTGRKYMDEEVVVAADTAYRRIKAVNDASKEASKGSKP